MSYSQPTMEHAPSHVVYPQTTHIVHQPSGIQIPNDPFAQMNGTWHAGLCSCFDNIGDCCCALFCGPCFTYSLAVSTNESCWSCMCVPYASAMYRMKIRTAYKIRGDAYSDHCATSCCGVCAAVQMRAELRAQGVR